MLGDVDLLAYLDTNQRQVATYFSGPLYVAAGAGTGKTRAITYRLAYAVEEQIYRPQHILAVTFTARAAGEMRGRLRTLGMPQVEARTFHSAALMQLRYFWPQAIGGYVPEIKENKFALVAGAASELNLPTDVPTIKDLAQEIEWSKVSLIAPEDYPERAAQHKRAEVAGCSYAELANLLVAYEEIKCRRGVIDFEDIILTLIGMLRDRKDIRDMVRTRYRHFVVDEYQDISPLQHRLLQLWLGDRKDICVVGDAAQTIYSFTGATAAYLTNFEQEFPGARRLVLNKNYRSAPAIISLANEIIVTGQFPDYVLLQAQRSLAGSVFWNKYNDDNAEATGIAAEIMRLSKAGTKLEDIAVLYRINSQSENFENAFRKAGIPYVIKGGIRFFERKEVKEAIISLRAEAKVTGDKPLPEFLEAAFYGLGWRATPPSQPGASREKWESLYALREIGRQIWETQRGSVADFLAELQERAEYQYEPALRAVTLSTIHAAKGLEWKEVFLAGVSEGLLPISMAISPAEIAEERRLLYVGVTRSRDNLYISYAKESGEKKRKVSRFLEDLWAMEETAIVSQQQRLSQRQRLQEENNEKQFMELPAARDLYEKLRQWRNDRAAQEQRAAFQILSNASLRRIAVEQPRNLAELSKIPGIGQKRLTNYGMEIIKLISDTSFL